jgi:GMP synthase (glutamine-hydrolysing)
MERETILIIDFGAQYSQLITRRVREANVYSVIHSHTITLEQVKQINPVGIILSGGPMSVNDEDAPSLEPGILKLGIPVLGICYGIQLIGKILGGEVETAKNKEYGKAILRITGESNIFKGVAKNSTVWMSHGDYLTRLPDNFKVIAESDHSPICAISNEEENIYGVQFHPEVMHTQEGTKIIRNFLYIACRCKGDWTSRSFVDSNVTKIKELVGDSKVICALSGGVDSTVAAVLVKKAIGENLICIHIDTGMMRKDESAQIGAMFDKKLNLNHYHVDAS